MRDALCGNAGSFTRLTNSLRSDRFGTVMKAWGDEQDHRTMVNGQRPTYYSNIPVLRHPGSILANSLHEEGASTSERNL